MPKKKQTVSLDYAVNILIDRFLPGKWRISEVSDAAVLLVPTGWLKKPRARQAADKLSWSGLGVSLDLDSSPPQLTVWDEGLCSLLGADDERPEERAHWSERRTA